ncbi:MAG TPA: DNA repair protein RecO, partial [Dehalococcoidia bacterium]|nr:DNA repair protein RecO [Dehalococcoidia bacterium]
MTKNYFATGIISKSSNFGEADSIFHLITREHGLVRAVAKSVRKPRSKLKGHLEILNQVTAYLRKGKNLDLITQVESINSFNLIKKNLKL